MIKEIVLDVIFFNFKLPSCYMRSKIIRYSL